MIHGGDHAATTQQPIKTRGNQPGNPCAKLLAFRTSASTTCGIHSFPQAAEADVPIGVVQSIVGHLSPQMTEHYTHIQSQAQQKAVKAIGNANKHLFQNLMLEDDKEGTGTVH
jgi:hypothetical protein